MPNLSRGAVSYVGTGCNQGIARAALTEDQKFLSILFDAYSARAGSHRTVQKSTAPCSVRIPFNVPSGYRLQIVKVEYRGFALIPAGANSTPTAAL